MKEPMRRCRNCGCLFKVCQKVKKHEYCHKKECQTARKRKWQRDELKNNAAYRQDQQTAQEDWINKNPGYWKNYRLNHPAYTDCNRSQQRVRNQAGRSKFAPDKKSDLIAKMDALTPERTILSGKYQLVPATPDMIAKMDALIVEINAISSDYAYSGP